MPEFFKQYLAALTLPDATAMYDWTVACADDTVARLIQNEVQARATAEPE
jgi:hypothetical protein